MSKYNKGKKLPKGISQRKDDGKFIAGFVDKAGRRHQRRFDTVVEADKWLYEMRHQDEYGDVVTFSKSTKAVDDLKILTVEEQRRFLDAAKDTRKRSPEPDIILEYADKRNAEQAKMWRKPFLES